MALEELQPLHRVYPQTMFPHSGPPISNFNFQNEEFSLVADFLLTIFTSAAVGAILSWLLLSLTKSWISERLKNAIKSEYDQKLETHKAELKAESDVAIENLKSRLRITATEHQVRFSKLHETRAQIIAETYALLRDLYEKVADYVKIFEPAGDRTKEERRRNVISALNALRAYYPQKQIFLPKKTAVNIRNIDSELVQAINQFVYGVELSKRDESTQIWAEVFERVNGKINTAIVELEDEFRELLGEKANMALQGTRDEAARS